MYVNVLHCLWNTITRGVSCRLYNLRVIYITITADLLNVCGRYRVADIDLWPMVFNVADMVCGRYRCNSNTGGYSRRRFSSLRAISGSWRLLSRSRFAQFDRWYHSWYARHIMCEWYLRESSGIPCSGFLAKTHFDSIKCQSISGWISVNKQVRSGIYEARIIE